MEKENNSFKKDFSSLTSEDLSPEYEPAKKSKKTQKESTKETPKETKEANSQQKTTQQQEKISSPTQNTNSSPTPEEIKKRLLSKSKKQGFFSSFFSSKKPTENILIQSKEQEEQPEKETILQKGLTQSKSTEKENSAQKELTQPKNLKQLNNKSQEKTRTQNQEKNQNKPKEKQGFFSSFFSSKKPTENTLIPSKSSEKDSEKEILPKKELTQSKKIEQKNLPPKELTQPKNLEQLNNKVQETTRTQNQEKSQDKTKELEKKLSTLYPEKKQKTQSKIPETKDSKIKAKSKQIEEQSSTTKKEPKKFELSPTAKFMIFMFFNLIITSIVYILYWNFIICLLVFAGIICLKLIYKVVKKKLDEANRITKMEDAFPDFLQLVSSNLRAGMTVDRAIMLSSREEFYPLDQEINSMGKAVLTGKELSIALKEMADRTNSPKIQKTIGLIIRGIHSGGNLAILLEQISANMRERVFLEKKAASSVLMYVIFIFFAVGVGAPVLFGLSSIMVNVLEGISSALPDISSSAAGSIDTPFQIQNVNLSQTFVIIYSIFFMLMIDILASLIIGSVNKGKERDGIKYIPPLIVLSLTIFFTIRSLLSGFFQGLLG